MGLVAPTATSAWAGMNGPTGASPRTDLPITRHRAHINQRQQENRRGKRKEVYRPGDRVELQDALSYVEQECLSWLAKGLNNDQIAEKLSLSTSTVKQRTSSIYSAFGLYAGLGDLRVLVTRWWWEVGVHAAPRRLRD